MQLKQPLLFFVCIMLTTYYHVDATVDEVTCYGVYWGTFDPPTRAHQQIMIRSFSTGIQQLFVVINNHGHKQYTASLQDRIAMVKLLISPELPITLLTQDATQTWGIEQLKNCFGNSPKVRWHLFSGQENLAHWNPNNEDSFDKVFIIPREGKVQHLIPASATQLRIAADCYTISSSIVRSRIKNLTPCWQQFVPATVAQYIKSHALYHFTL
ncbi:MAG: hypothetical protein AB7F19_05155 [Candidatus Babeliales bacterium]